MLTALEQSGKTAVYVVYNIYDWAAYNGDVNMVQMLVDHCSAVDLGRNEVTNDYMDLLTCGWSLGVVSLLSML